jgi:hypothetical protein
MKKKGESLFSPFSNRESLLIRGVSAFRLVQRGLNFVHELIGRQVACPELI